MHPPKIIAFSRTRGAPVAPHIQQRCVDRIVQCHGLLKTDMVAPTLSFDLRGTTAGQAFPAKHHIRLNGQLLNENTDEFIEQTVGHEWAHLAAAHLHGHRIAAHGTQWKTIMRKLGLPPERCHTYATQKARAVKPRTAPRVAVVKPKKALGAIGVPVLPPKTKVFVPPAVTISIVLPGGMPSSPEMWSYATKLATKKNAQLPVELQDNRAMLTQWIDLVRQR